DMRIYSIFDTEAILNRPPEVLVDAHSGAAGIAHWINRHTESRVDKKDPLVQRVKQAVDVCFAAGRTTALSNEELAEIFRRCSAEEA
ncbi:MAG: 2-isopropylmalate synthase, partial [Clostridia bacterium]|nr:2-isopropylmalate synthase [Clostridia bacterium]